MSAARPYSMTVGSVAWRVVEHLQAHPAGLRMGRDVIAKMFSTNPSNVTTLLAKPVQAGILTFTKEGRHRYYHLPEVDEAQGTGDGRLQMRAARDEHTPPGG